jgi:hypothetical protein
LSQLLLKTSKRQPSKSNTEEYAEDYKPHNDDGLQDDEPQEDELQEDEDEPQDAHYPLYPNENESDVDDNSGVVLSHRNRCLVVRCPATSPGFKSANWEASHE